MHEGGTGFLVKTYQVLTIKKKDVKAGQLKLRCLFIKRHLRKLGENSMHI